MQTHPVNECAQTNLFLKPTKLQDEVISGTRNTPSSSLAISSSFPLFSRQTQKKKQIAKIFRSLVSSTFVVPWPIKHFLHFFYMN